MAARGPITTHILDLETGLPGKGVFCKLVRRKDRDLKNTNVDIEKNEWETLNVVQTNDDGRADFLKGIESSPLAFGYYYIEFGVQSYFAQQNRQAFYPKVVINFVVDSERHYHVPLLISSYGFSTYRGS